MAKKSTGLKLLCFLCWLVSLQPIFAQNPPSGFASMNVSSLWDEAVGIAFTEDGTEMFVWERAGRVWLVKNNQRQLILNISEEVAGYSDHGLLGFALHPHFDENGYIYLLYVVDRHHLINYGTAAYNPATNDYFKATIGRLTRYTATKTVSGYSIDPASRKVLIGSTITNGIVETSGTHGVGSLVFGTDHTLLVSVGDGASPYNGDVGNLNLSNYAQALADGMMRPEENVGVYRSQLLNSLSGKILRIDPETGAGIPSNPFYDAMRPDAPISKVYTLGVRNAFRISVKPGTGSHSPADGNPGIIYYGDVGWNLWEEIGVIDKPGLNMGWPIYEGLDVTGTSIGYSNYLVPNYDAPNPLYGVNGCNQQYFYFNDLLKHATLTGTAIFNNPCNPAVPIPSNIHTFVHTRPLIDWHHENPLTRTGTFNGSTPTATNLSGAGSPVSGPQFKGSAAVGGVFYTGSDFPQEYQNTYFFGDYSGMWIRNLTVDANDKPVAVKNFVDNNSSVVFMATHPTEEGLYYVNFGAEIRKIYYSANRPPIAKASVNNMFGATPLTVQFTGSNSTDPESLPLTYEWNFGDGSPLSVLANPGHTYTAPPGVPTKFTATLKVTDNLGVVDQTSLIVSVNNTPPQVTIISPVNNTLYPLDHESVYPLQATVTDQEHSQAQLTYQWQTILHHAAHEHPEPFDTSPVSSTTITPLGCDGQTYYYRIVLTVTDPAGGSTTKEVKLYPDCNGVGKATPIINWANPASIVVGTPLGPTQLNATATDHGNPVAGTFTYSPVSGTILPLGNNQQLSVNFVPTDPALYNTVAKTVTINVVNANQPPVVSVPIPDQTAVVGAAFNYTVPATTFSDPDAGTTLVYSASLSTGGPLPAWLTFNVNTRTFSGIPTGTDVGTQGIRVTVSDGAGGSINDVFALTVNASGGSGLFYRAINLNGPAISIDGNNWEASATALNFSYTTNQKGFVNQAVTLIPATDANRATMIRSSIYGSNMTYTINVPNATYQVWIYVWEDNFAQTFTVSMEGIVVQANINSGAAGAWKKLGPFQANIADGAINISSTGQDANFSGIEIWSVGAPPNQPPVVALPIVDQSTTAGIPFSFTFPSNTFTDPNAGTVLTYAASLSNGNTLPLWLTFNPSTRNFSGTSTSNDVGVLDIRVTASDGAGGSISDVFALTVNSVIKVTPVITWANPAPITTAMPLSSTQLNAVATDSGNPVAGTMTYTPAAGTLLNVGNGQQLNVTFTPTNTSLFNSVSKTVTIDVIAKVNPLLTWANPVAITSGTALSATQLNAVASDAGNPLAGTYNYTPAIGTVLNVGNAQQLSVTFLPTNSAFYNSVSKTVTIDVNAKVTPLINWSNPSPIISGTALSATQLNATVTDNGNPVAGTLTYNPTLGTILAVGTAHPLSVSFVPTNTTVYNNASKTVSIDVNPKVTPLINWSNPAAITEGTALSSTQLNATVTDNGVPVPGTLTYTPAVGTLLSVGAGQTLSVNFVPTNSTLYNSVSKSVLISVNPLPKVTPLITWANPAPITVGTPLGSTQLNATASYNAIPLTGVFSYTPASGTVLSAGNGQQLLVNFQPDNSAQYNSVSKTVSIDVTSTTPTAGFYRAINVNGPAITIDANNWEASATAPNFSYTTNQRGFVNQAVTLIPATDANRATMIRSSIYGSNMTFSINVPNATYQVWIYVWEDNFAQTFSVSMESTVVQPNFNSGAAGAWKKLGPFQLIITDGAINIASTGQDANFSGIEIWTVGAPPQNQPPVVSLPIADQTTNAGVPFTFTLASNTFTDPDAGTVLSLASTQPNGSALPLWLNFNPTTRTFSGTPSAADAGTFDVRVTALDGAGGMVSDIFALTVNPIVKVTPLITWANPTAIASGTALSSAQLNATAAYNGTPVAGSFVYSPAAGTVLGVGTGQTLTVNFTPSNTTLYNSAGKSVTIDVNAAQKITPLITWANPAAITVGTALSGTQLNATATNNGTPVAGTFTYTPVSGTVLNAGIAQPLTVNFVPTNTTTYNSVSKTVTIDVNAVQKITPLITWANPAAITVGTALSGTQLNATATNNGTPVAGTFTYTPVSGTVLNAGIAQPLTVNFVPTNTMTYNSVSKTVAIDVNALPTTSFYRAINLNGPALVIDGNNWQATAGAPNFTYTTDRGVFENQAVPLVPATDASRAQMLRSSIWGVNVNLNLGVPAGTYQVYLYVWEDNNPAIFSIAVEGATVLSNYNSGAAGTWKKLGPYQTTINDGSINVVASGGHANLSGLEVHQVNQSGAREAAENIVTGSEFFEPNDGLQLSAHPNPFSKNVNIAFTAMETAHTSLAMFDIRGIQIHMLFEGNMLAGASEQLVVESEDLPDGVYVLRLINGTKIGHFKVAIAR